MYRRDLVQSGRGIGGLFRSIFKIIRPVASTIAKTSKPVLKKLAKSNFVKKVGKDVLKTGVQTAVDSLNDIAEGKKPSSNKMKKNFEKLGKKSIKRASNTLANVLDDAPAIKKKKYVKGKKKKNKKSIYN